MDSAGLESVIYVMHTVHVPLAAPVEKGVLLGDVYPVTFGMSGKWELAQKTFQGDDFGEDVTIYGKFSTICWLHTVSFDTYVIFTLKRS